MDKVIQWAEGKSKYTHYAVAVGTALMAAYVGYPPFHALIKHYYDLIPANGKVLIDTAAFIYALYRNPQQGGQQP